jgi:hypothetical protein
VKFAVIPKQNNCLTIVESQSKHKGVNIMLKQNCASIVLAAAAITFPTLLSVPANAQTEVYVIADRDRDWNRDGRPNSVEVRTIPNQGWNRDGRPNPREVRNRSNWDNWNRDDRRNPREVRNRSNWDNWNRDDRRNPREVRNRSNWDNWNRDDRPYVRVVRLGNGDIRYPNGQIIPARSIARLRNQGYFRLPNGDILLPSQEIVPAGRLVRVRDGYFRLPDGLILQINL